MNLPESTRSQYARQLADEAKTLVPGMERLSEIAEELRADDLFRTLGYDTWEVFCTDYLGVSKRTANRWIGARKSAAMPTAPATKSISETAGHGVAAGQNVPVVESGALKSENAPSGESPVAEKGLGSDAPEGRGRELGTSPARATKTGIDDPARVPDFPSGATSGGVDAGSAPVLRSPTAPDVLEVARSGAKPIEPNTSDDDDDVPGSPDPAFQRPLNPPELTSGPAWTAMSADELTDLLYKVLDALTPTELWNGSDEDQRETLTTYINELRAVRVESTREPEKRRSGYKTTPADRAKAKLEAVPEPDPDPTTCDHPKAKRRQLGYGTFCGVCNARMIA